MIFCWLVELRGGETLQYYEGPGADAGVMLTEDPWLAMRFEEESTAQLIGDSIAIWLEGPRVATRHAFEPNNQGN